MAGQGGQHACQIFSLASFRSSKSMKGATKKRPKTQKVKQEYQKQVCANFKNCNQWTRSFCKCNFVFILCNDFSLNIKLRLLSMHKYCNQLVTNFSIFSTNTQLNVSQQHYIRSLLDLLGFVSIIFFYSLNILNKYLVIFFAFIFKSIYCN